MKLQTLCTAPLWFGSVQLELKFIKTSSQYLHGKKREKPCTLLTFVKFVSASWRARAPLDTAAYSLFCYCLKPRSKPEV